MKLLIAILLAPVFYKFDDEYGKEHLAMFSFVLGSMVFSDNGVQQKIGWAGLWYLSKTTGEVSTI